MRSSPPLASPVSERQMIPGRWRSPTGTASGSPAALAQTRALFHGPISVMIHSRVSNTDISATARSSAAATIDARRIVSARPCSIPLG